MNNIKINWNYKGKTNISEGTGANFQEKLLGRMSGLIVPLFFLIFINFQELDLNIFQLILALILGYDLGGGMICNSLNSCKRLYHSELKPGESRLVKLAKNHWFFVIIHIHTIVIGVVFGGFNLFYGISWYLILLLSALIVNITPLYLRRPISMLLVLTAIMLNLYVITAVQGFEWVVPVLFIKIIYGHLVREEPYRPV